MIISLKGLGYEERLKRLRFPSLKHSRRRDDMLQVSKVLNGIDKIDPSLFFTMVSSSSTGGHR